MILVPTYYETNALGVPIDRDEINTVYRKYGLLFSASGERISDRQYFTGIDWYREGYCHMRLSAPQTEPEK
jgi:hypothetical protein